MIYTNREFSFRDIQEIDMQPRLLKNQVALFGSFHFPPTPETIVKLVEAFASLGFMPQVINTNDLVSGLSIQKITLSRGSDTQIQFASDRIDIVNTMPSVSDVAPFIVEVLDYLSRIEKGSLKFTRVGLVQDYLLESLPADREREIRMRLLPHSGESPNEWMARWVEPRVVDDGKYNICLEAMVAPGLMMIMNNKIQPVNGVKVLYDISTSPENMASRFNSSNIEATLNSLNGLIQLEKAFFQV